MDLYVLRPWSGNPFNPRFAIGEVADPVHAGDPRSNGICPVCKEGLGSCPWLPPQRMVVRGSPYPDFLWPAGDLAMSARALAAFHSAGLTGIVRADGPIEVIASPRKRVGQAALPDYYNIWYIHGGADVDDRASHAVRPRGLCRKCRQGTDAIRGVVLRPGSWTGHDIFAAFGLIDTILITERFASLVQKDAFTNAMCVPAEEYAFDFRRP